MAERFEIVQKALLKMLEDKKYATLRDILVTMNPSDIAASVHGVPPFVHSYEYFISIFFGCQP